MDSRRPLAAPGGRRRVRMVTASCAIVVATSLLGACARFDEAESAPFSPAPEMGSAFDAEPRVPQPDMPGPPPMSSPSAPPSAAQEGPSGPCDDPDPAVIATCLEPTVAVAGMPTAAQAIIAERATGRLLVVSDNADPQPFSTIDPSAGQVVGIALSPSFEQDKLVYALLTRDGQTRVARIAAGDSEKIVGDNLPANTTGTGGIAFVDGILTVGVGTEVLRFPDFNGIGQIGRSEPVGTVSGDITGLCTPPLGDAALFATTTSPTGSAVQQVNNGAVVELWAWPDQPLASGCAVTPGGIAVALPEAERVDLLGLNVEAGVVDGSPQSLAVEKYGRIAGVGLMASNAIVATTVNKDGGQPVASDDRAVILPIAGGSSDERS